ncbi:MAG: hypothetical protein ABSH51_16885 [Solirubrobacteraceae bacterium]|jgi:hypothetical protein
MSPTFTSESDVFAGSSEAARPSRTVIDEIREGGLPAIAAAAKADKPLACAVLSSAVLFIAGLGPQANTTDSVSVGPIAVGSVTTHSAVPGWTFVLLAVIAATGLVLFVRSSDRSWLWMTRVAAAFSILGGVITYLQIAAQSAVGLGGVGWGFVAGLLASCVLAVSSRILARRVKQPSA